MAKKKERRLGFGSGDEGGGQEPPAGNEREQPETVLETGPTNAGETLLEMAKREADQVDKEIEQGYQPPDPTYEQKTAAKQVYQELKNRVANYGPEKTIEALVQVIDMIPPFLTPKEWPGEEKEEYAKAPTIEAIGTMLLKGCHVRLPIAPSDVLFLWRNKAKWTIRGQTVHGSSAGFDTRTSFLLEGRLAAVEMNFHDFKTLNPLQKTFAVYRALRKLDEKGGSVAPDFSGYLDEVELFSLRVFREMVTLENAMRRGGERRYPLWQLSLFDVQPTTETHQEAAD